MTTKLDLKAQKGALDAERLDGGDKPTLTYELWHGPAEVSAELIADRGSKAAAAQPAQTAAFDTPFGFGAVEALAFPGGALADAGFAFAEASAGASAAMGFGGGIFADGPSLLAWGELPGFGSGLDLMPLDPGAGFHLV